MRILGKWEDPFLPCWVTEVVRAGSGADCIGWDHDRQDKGLSLPMPQFPLLKMGVRMILTLGDCVKHLEEYLVCTQMVYVLFKT